MQALLEAKLEKARLKHEEAVGVMDKGDFRAALNAFYDVLKSTTNSPNPMTYLNIGVCHARFGEFKEALSILKEAVQRWPDNARIKENFQAINNDWQCQQVTVETEQAKSARGTPPPAASDAGQQHQKKWWRFWS